METKRNVGIPLNINYFGKNRSEEIQQRLETIGAELETRQDSLTAEELQTLSDEVNTLREEKRTLLEAQQKRAKLLDDIANERPSGSGGSPVVRSRFNSQAQNGENTSTEVVDHFDTPQYRQHFMEFICRGKSMPEEFAMQPLEVRVGDVTTTTGDTGAVIPTTIMNEIIREAKTFGNIYKGVRHLNISGGVAFPILTLIPTASWIGETETSDRQKIQAKKSVTFNFHGLECRISQTLLVSVVTIKEFQNLFVRLAAEAIVKALDIVIINGTGTGQPTGVLNETRIPTANIITLLPSEISSWKGWKEKVFAKMKKSYRDGIFIMAQGTFDGQISGMVDETGQPIGRVNYGIDGGEVYRFGGRNIEIVEDEILPSYEDAATGDPIAIFMRLQDYAINTNLQMRVVKWFDHDKNEYVNKAILIVDGKVIDPHGILIIKKG